MINNHKWLYILETKNKEVIFLNQIINKEEVIIDHLYDRDEVKCKIFENIINLYILKIS